MQRSKNAWFGVCTVFVIHQTILLLEDWQEFILLLQCIVYFYRTKLCFDDEEKVVPHHVTDQLPEPPTKRLFVNDVTTNDDVTFFCKRSRSVDLPTSSSYTTSTAEVVYSPVSSIIRAVERLSTDTDRVADGSRDNVLPTLSGKHKDLNAISPKTVSSSTKIILFKKV